MLRNRRLLGEHSPVERSKEHGKNVPTGQLVEHYYPQVIPPATFEQVQTILKSRKPFSGRQDATNLNIFRNLLVCAECGGSTRFMLRSGKEFYYCTASMTGGCVDDQIRSIRGEFLRRVLFKFEHWTAIRDYIAAGSDVLKTLKKEETVAVAKLNRLEIKAEGLKNKFAAEDDEDKAETYVGLLTDTRKAIATANADIDRIKQELASLDGAFALSDSNVDSFESMLTSDSEQARTDRQRLNRYLRGIFLKLELHFPTRRLVTQPIPALANRISPVVAYVEQPKDKRTGDDYGHHTWISKDKQTLIIRSIKARLRRAGIPSPTFEQVKPIYESVVYTLLPKSKPQCKSQSELADLPEEFKGLVWKAPDPFLK
nr:recombinase family protein [Pseudomonas sp. Choline-02u-1]